MQRDGLHLALKLFNSSLLSNNHTDQPNTVKLLFGSHGQHVKGVSVCFLVKWAERERERERVLSRVASPQVKAVTFWFYKNKIADLPWSKMNPDKNPRN